MVVYQMVIDRYETNVDIHPPRSKWTAAKNDLWEYLLSANCRKLSCLAQGFYKRWYRHYFAAGSDQIVVQA